MVERGKAAHCKRFVRFGCALAAQLSQLLLECKDDPLTQLGLDEAPFKRAHARYKAIVRQGRRTHPRRRTLIAWAASDSGPAVPSAAFAPKLFSHVTRNAQASALSRFRC